MHFIIRLGNGRYISSYLLTSSHLDYESTRTRTEAFHLNDVDSGLVLKRLLLKGQKATRHGVTQNPGISVSF